MKEMSKITGRKYAFYLLWSKDATDIIIVWVQSPKQYILWWIN